MANSRLSMATTDRNGSGWPMKRRISQVPTAAPNQRGHMQGQADPQGQGAAIGGLDHLGDGAGVMAGGGNQAVDHGLDHLQPAALGGYEAADQGGGDGQAAERRQEQVVLARGEAQPVGQQADPDQGVDQLGDDLEGDVDHAGAEGLGRADPAKHRRPGGDDHPAELGERQHVGRRLAQQPAPDEHRRAVRRAGRDQPPGQAQRDEQGELGGDDHQEAAHADGADRRQHARRR